MGHLITIILDIKNFFDFLKFLTEKEIKMKLFKP